MDTTFPNKLYNKASTNIEERKQLIPIISWIDYLIDACRIMGLLALEDIQEFHHSIHKENFLTKGVFLTITGLEKELLEKLLLTTIFVTKCEGIDLLKRMVIYHGVMGILDFENKEGFHQLILPLIGPEILEIIDTEIVNTSNTLYNRLLLRNGYMPFEELTNMYDYQVKEILNRETPDLVIPLLIGGTTELRQKIWTNLGQLRRYNYLQLLFSIDNSETIISDFIFAQQRINKRYEIGDEQ